MSMGQATIDWYFEPADRLIDRTVVRDIFGVPQEANVREEVDKIVVSPPRNRVNLLNSLSTSFGTT
jgi:hypothetical protein